MRFSTYRYNTETCQFERVKLSARNIIWYALGLIVAGACMLIGILLLHDLLVNSDHERRLRKENRALREHHAILSAELNDLQPVLTSLENKDRVLHKRFFGPLATPPGEKSDRASKEDFLLADAASFRKQVSQLTTTSHSLLETASITNTYFKNKFLREREEFGSLTVIPTLQPVTPWQGDRLISGYGMRVNPFHKGLYEHLGVDVAVVRGTPVLATAAGVVREAKQSDLEAGYGNYIEIDHGEGWVTRYAHLEELSVRYGTRVKKGQTIGAVGSSGGSIAPHLHYEILHDGKNVDPVYYMIEGLTDKQHHRLTFRSHQQNQSLD